MRFMMLVKADESTEAGMAPTGEPVAAMDVYNEEPVAAGVLPAAEGLSPSSAGVRVSTIGGERTVRRAVHRDQGTGPRGRGRPDPR